MDTLLNADVVSRVDVGNVPEPNVRPNLNELCMVHQYMEDVVFVVNNQICFY